MSILQETWLCNENGQVVKADGTTIADETLNRNYALLLSKVPELWRDLTQAQNQLEMVADCLANGRNDEAMLHANSLWRQRKELIQEVLDIAENEELATKKGIH